MFHWIRIIGLLLPLAAFVGASTVATPKAEANECDSCKDKCRKGVDECKKAGPKALCKGPAKIVCEMFKNFQCPAAGSVCRKLNCGLGSCNPPSGPKGGSMSGDPHILTLDRMRYDFQAVGEFWAGQSEKAEVEMQVRFTSTGSPASFVNMLAVRSGEHRVIFEAGKGLVVDDQSIVFEEGTLYLSEKVSLTHMPKGKILLQVEENNIWVHVRASYINYYVEPHSSTSNSWKGLMGNFDGKPENDFQTREGKVFERSEVTREVLYGEFSETWRVTQAESFLLYREGETTETFTDKEHPREHVTIADLDGATFTKARATCIAKGVLRGEALRNCIYDVGISASDVFVEGYQEALPMEAQGALHYPSKFGVHVQAASHQGDFVPLYWAGALDLPIKYSLHQEDGKRVATGRGRGENPILVRLPSQVGIYTIKLVQGEQEIERPLAVTEAVATVDVPGSVTGGSDFKVSWTGPIGKNDFVALTKAGEKNARSHMTYAWARTGGETEFTAPAAAGEYEIRYILSGATDSLVLASKTFTVTEAKASVTPPKEIRVGGSFLVEWTGPAGGSDYIDLVVAGTTKTSGHLSYGWVRSSKEGKVKVRGPADPGAYEVRYIANSRSGRAVVSTTKVTVKDVKADMQLPSSVPAGEKFEVTWTGPMNASDYIGIGPTGSKEGRGHLHYIWANHKGKGKLKAPDEPGSYEVWYVLQGVDKRRTLQSKKIEVKAK